MSESTIPDLTGSAALPRNNGELIFDEPWESRAFGMAVALTESGAYEWEDFRSRLITEIQAWEQEHGTGAAETPSDEASWSYYQRWLASLEGVLIERGVISRSELAERETVIAAHDDHDDHAHDHGHTHDHAHAHDTREVTT